MIRGWQSAACFARKSVNLPLLLQVSVLAYGAFVDIGAITDGLVHVSQMTVSIYCHVMPATCRAPLVMLWIQTMRQLIDMVPWQACHCIYLHHVATF